MKTIRIANTDLCVPQIALGCMRLGDRGPDGAKAFVDTALELGLNFLTMPISMAAARAKACLHRRRVCVRLCAKR